MKRILIALSLLVIAGALMTGCKTCCQPSHDTGAFVPVNTTVNDLENHEFIVLLDPRVQYSVTCSGIQQRTLADGRMQVIANIRNREGRQIQVQINCVFKDVQGFPTEGDETPFRNLILNENAQEPVTFISLNNKAVRYTIRIREAR